MTSAQLFPGYKHTIGVGYVVLPNDIERADYIKDCYSNLQISIVCEDGAFHNRVSVSQEILNFLVFPDTSTTVGSAVLYGTEEKFSQPVILMRLSTKDEYGDGKEHQFIFRRKFNDQIVEINGCAKDGVLNFIVDGGGKKGLINLHIFNKNQDCELKIDVAGDLNVQSSNNATFNQQKSFNVKTDDGDDNASFSQSTTENKFSNKKLIINDGKDPLTLYNELKDFMSKLLDKISEITTATAIGTQPILNAEEFVAMKEDLDKFKSEVIFIDK